VLTFSLPNQPVGDDTPKANAGIQFGFDSSQDFTKYKSLEITIDFDGERLPFDLGIVDTNGKDAYVHVDLDTHDIHIIENEQNYIFSIPLTLIYKDDPNVDKRSIENIEFNIFSTYTSGDHVLKIRDIKLKE